MIIENKVNPLNVERCDFYSALVGCVFMKEGEVFIKINEERENNAYNFSKDEVVTIGMFDEFILVWAKMIVSD